MGYQYNYNCFCTHPVTEKAILVSVELVSFIAGENREELRCITVPMWMKLFVVESFKALATLPLFA